MENDAIMTVMLEGYACPTKSKYIERFWGSYIEINERDSKMKNFMKYVYEYVSNDNINDKQKSKSF